MGVRVKVRIELAGKVVEAVALANSGFETERPQLLVPYVFLVKNHVRLEALGNSIAMEYDTAGGPITMHMYPEACTVTVVEEDRTSKSVKADVVISPVEREILMSDALMEELGIVIVSPKSGLWKFIDDAAEKIRRSHKPQYHY